MAIELRWLASMTASAFHAAEALWRGESLLDDALQEALDRPLQDLVEEIRESGLEEHRLLPMLTALSMGIQNNRELVGVAISKIHGRGDSAGEVTRRIAGRIADLVSAFSRTLPGVADQLVLRGQPLREQWEARGPGMLLHFGQRTDVALVPKRADVALVYPVLGGDGVAHLSFNTVRMEAVLANPFATLPETVRLAWLLSQLQLDLPLHSEQFDRRRLNYLARLATLPAILDAARYVESIPSDFAALPFALSAWRIVPQPDVESTVETVSRWWQTYQEKHVPMRIALSSLDRLLREAEVAAV